MIQFDDEEEATGSGDWMTTYADLMSLLMCFFVLLFSFSEMDVAKYKQIAGSMAHAFGIQKEIKIKEIPKGTSVVAKEFSPGRPAPTKAETVRQQTTSLQAQLGTPSGAAGKDGQGARILLPSEVASRMMEETRRRETAEAVAYLKAELQKQIEEGKIEIEHDMDSITVRIRERGSFPTASAHLSRDFLPTIPVIQTALRRIDGEIAVEGHTDNVPIHNARFLSNWALSTERALALAHALLQDKTLEARRFMVVGYADTRPRATNETPEGRAQNRRVEVVVRRSPPPTETPVPETAPAVPIAPMPE
ncbi:MAG: OmpA family protein [Pseudomonadales bacterium]|nr:OmpA family protein [Pseudomonadales bacterium]